MTNLIWRNGLAPAEAEEVTELLTAAASADGVEAVGEAVLLRLRQHGPVTTRVEPVCADLAGSEHFLIRLADGRHLGDALAGYAHLDTSGDAEGRWVAELAVHPDHRGQAVGTRLVQALIDRLGVPPGSDRLRIWAHGGHPAALAIAKRLGLRTARELLLLSRPLTDEDRVEPTPPAGVTLRTFRPGRDEAAVVAVNNRAFSWHPEQSGWTDADVRLREEQDWFDPEGFLLAVDERDQLLGFHWTKVHPVNGVPTGEVYVIGIDPEAQGRGLGRTLTAAGLAHLARRGLDRVTLYVESDNAAALSVYRKAGFIRSAADLQFSW